MAAHLSIDDLKIMAEDLPSAIGKSSDSRSRLLCVLDILKTYTDENHGLTANQIREILKYRLDTDGSKPSEPTILKDLQILIGSHIQGLTIEKPPRGTNEGFKCTRASLSSPEARMLINIVKSCKYITQEQCVHLCSQLENMVSYYQQDQIAQDVYIEQRIRSGSPDVFRAVDEASYAIKANKKLAFKYCYYNLEGQEAFLQIDNTEWFVETPIAIIYSFNNYYLETWSDVPVNGSNVLVRRMERIREPQTSSLDAVQNQTIEQLQSTVKERTREKFDMMSGPRCEVFLKVSSYYSNMAFNRFGFDHCFEHITRQQDGQQFGYLRLTVQLSGTFYRWLFGANGGIKLVKPKSSIWATSGSWNNLATSSKPIEELIADYKKARSEYIEYVQNAIQIYEE